MFAQFDSIFSLKEGSRRLPEALVDMYNEGLPDGLHYELSGNRCVLCPDSPDSQLTVESKNPVYRVIDGSKVAFSSKNLNEAMAFQRNSLLPVIVHSEEHLIRFSGVEDPVAPGEFVKGPDIEEDSFCMMLPPPEPLEVELTFDGGGCVRTFSFRQSQENSVSTMTLSSTDNYPLTISYSVVLNSSHFKMSANIVRAKAHSAVEYLEAMKIYKAIMEGDCLIGGQAIRLKSATQKEDDRIPSRSTISFWERVAAIEGRIGCSFDLTTGIDEVSCKAIDELYCGLVLGKAVMRRYVAEAISFDELLNPEVSEGMPVFATISQVSRIALFGGEYSFTGYAGIINAPVDRIELDDDGSGLIHFKTGEGVKPNIAFLFVDVGSSLLEEPASQEVVDALLCAKYLQETLYAKEV